MRQKAIKQCKKHLVVNSKCFPTANSPNFLPVIITFITTHNDRKPNYHLTHSLNYGARDDAGHSSHRHTLQTDPQLLYFLQQHTFHPFLFGGRVSSLLIHSSSETLPRARPPPGNSPSSNQGGKTTLRFICRCV